MMKSLEGKESRNRREGDATREGKGNSWRGEERKEKEFWERKRLEGKQTRERGG